MPPTVFIAKIEIILWADNTPWFYDPKGTETKWYTTNKQPASNELSNMLDALLESEGKLKQIQEETIERMPIDEW